MTPTTRYSRAKQLFLAASALPVEERAQFIEEASGDDEALRDEVQSLLGWRGTQSAEASASKVTLLVPGRGQRRSSSRSSARTGTPGLPADLLNQSADRVRVVALVYAFVYFMSDPFQTLMFGTARKAYLSSVAVWGPGAISISTALLVAAFIRSPRMPLSVVMYLSLAFEVIGSYGIAASEYLSYNFVASGSLGLSWVAVWTLLFTIVVPAPPRLAIRAALASVSAVPVVIWISLNIRSQVFHPTWQQFLFGVVLPYLLVAGMAAIGARAVYSLGTEVRRARELGSYRLVERIGTGGMGEVWRARHSLLARPAAIKLIRPTLLGASAVDGRADIYSAGCVAYWLLTGQLVFTADTPMGLLLHHAKTMPTPPSVVSELPIPARLEQLVMSCLAKDPVDRPQSARELSRRLEEIEDSRAWSAERARDWWALHEPGEANSEQS